MENLKITPRELFSFTIVISRYITASKIVRMLRPMMTTPTITIKTLSGSRLVI